LAVRERTLTIAGLIAARENLLTQHSPAENLVTQRSPAENLVSQRSPARHT
jgi:hypothetical protein